MNINLIRIDDRLIHGQIITKWLSYSKAKLILVVDELAASSPIHRTILSLAVPSGIKLEVLNMKNALIFIKEANSDVDTLLILRTPCDLLSFIKLGFEPRDIEVVLGNMGFDEKVNKTRRLLDYIYVNENDVIELLELERIVSNLQVKAIPDEKTKYISNLVK